MTHYYEILGVSPGASPSEVRRAYLAAARRSHPDHAGAAGDDAMRDLNIAWSVLGDPDARREYDRTLAIDDEPANVTINRPPAKPFVPYHAVDEDDDDTWRYTDDPTDPATAPSFPMLAVPVGLAVAGLLALCAAAVIGLGALAALGGVLLALGAVAFLVVPMLVMGRASHVEAQRSQKRDRPGR